jgi:hypothetical protein
MDTEKYLEVQRKIRKGQSPNDEGPFYHHSKWESYKGSIKGKLGGAIIGGLVGAVIGGVVAGLLATGIVGPGLAALGIGKIALTVAAMAGAGIMYGMHEFGDIGKIGGAVAAGLKQADAREAVRFAAIEKKLDTLSDLVQGKPAAADSKNAADTAVDELENYRTTHYAKVNGSKPKLVFWKVALIGLAVGAAAGAVLAAGGISGEIFHALGHALPANATAVISVVTCGLFGASFGINRDIFRRIFDTTDLWSKGIIKSEKVREHQIAAGKDLEEAIAQKKEAPESAVTTMIMHEGHIDYPISGTFHRDRIAAEKALLSFDHTRATPQ